MALLKVAAVGLLALAGGAQAQAAGGHKGHHKGHHHGHKHHHKGLHKHHKAHKKMVPRRGMHLGVDQTV